MDYLLKEEIKILELPKIIGRKIVLYRYKATCHIYITFSKKKKHQQNIHLFLPLPFNSRVSKRFNIKLFKKYTKMT